MRVDNRRTYGTGRPPKHTNKGTLQAAARRSLWYRQYGQVLPTKVGVVPCYPLSAVSFQLLSCFVSLPSLRLPSPSLWAPTNKRLSGASYSIPPHFHAKHEKQRTAENIGKLHNIRKYEYVLSVTIYTNIKTTWKKSTKHRNQRHQPVNTIFFDVFTYNNKK